MKVCTCATSLCAQRKNMAVFQVKPIFSKTHSSEGYALAWSQEVVGALASGDCQGKLHTWAPREGGSWEVSNAFAGHSASVEDVEWSPTEGTVLASACVDKVRMLRATVLQV
jgi:WD40 repeat protein